MHREEWIGYSLRPMGLLPADCHQRIAISSVGEYVLPEPRFMRESRTARKYSKRPRGVVRSASFGTCYSDAVRAVAKPQHRLREGYDCQNSERISHLPWAVFSPRLGRRLLFPRSLTGKVTNPMLDGLPQALLRIAFGRQRRRSLPFQRHAAGWATVSCQRRCPRIRGFDIQTRRMRIRNPGTPRCSLFRHAI